MPAMISLTYAHEDEALKNELLGHLSGLRRLVAWPRERDAASVVLLLVSSHFLRSEACRVETERALARRAQVIPILLRQCAWEEAPFAHATVAPANLRPVTAWSDRAEAFEDVIGHVRRAVSSAGCLTNLPPRNPRFSGRETQLARLRDTLLADKRAALFGPGGVGKSELALEYAHRHAEEYAFIWWIRAAQASTLAADYEALDAPLGLRDRSLEAVRTQLTSISRRWLLIFDDALHAELVKPYLPRGGHVIITSREARWRYVATPIFISSMSRDDATKFLLQRSGTSDRTAAAALAKELDDLPLALEHAAASGMSADEIRKHRKDVHILEASAAERTVAATCRIALEKIHASDPAAVELLKFYAFLAPDDIPRNLLHDLPPAALLGSLRRLGSDAAAMDRALEVLGAHAMIRVSGDAVAMHRLLQSVIRDEMVPQDERQWTVNVLHALMAPFQSKSHHGRGMPDAERLVPHVQHVVAAARPLQTLLDGTVLPRRPRRRLRVRAEYGPAAGRSLAVVLERAGERADAEVALAESRELLERDRRDCGDGDALVVRDRNNIAVALLALGRDEEATAQLLEVTRILPRDVGVETEAFKTTFGLALLRDGQSDTARAELGDALQIAEKLYGAGDARLIAPLQNVAVATREGEPLQRALEIARTTFDDAHPETARARFALALHHLEQGDLADAVDEADHAVDAFMSVFGEKNNECARHVARFAKALADHPELASNYAALAARLRES